MTKRQDLYLQRRSRSEQSDQRQPDQAANISHQPRASPNSTPLASRIEFPTMTGGGMHIGGVGDGGGFHGGGGGFHSSAGFHGAGLGGGGFRGGGFHGRFASGGFHGGGFHRGGFHRRAFVGFGLGSYGYYDGYYPYAYNDDYYDDGGCYVVRRRVHTRYGWGAWPAP